MDFMQKKGSVVLIVWLLRKYHQDSIVRHEVVIQTFFFEKIRKKVHIIGKLSHNEEEDVKLRLVWDEYKDDYCQCCQFFFSNW